MNKKIIVFGAGYVGGAIAADLVKSGHDILVVDNNRFALEKLKPKGMQVLEADFLDFPAYSGHLEATDLVVGASPGRFGYNLMKGVIKAGKDMVDISFSPEDSLQLDSFAREKGVILVTDIGVAPGMCNVILGYHNARMEVNRYRCLVGGLPKKREWPLEYKASWSPRDVIEEYTRPARLKENGRIVVKEALSDLQLINLDPVGSLEEWNSDGLRSLLDTMPHIPNMVEKTLRYPGSSEYLKVLRELGFFSEAEIEISGKSIKPVDVSAELLRRNWLSVEGDKEFTLMHIEIEGIQEGKERKYFWDMYDETDADGVLSMSRTTGYTCTAVAEMLLRGLYTRKGVSPPEHLGVQEEHFAFIREYLAERGINYRSK